MKKNYIQPTAEVVAHNTSAILLGSNDLGYSDSPIDAGDSRSKDSFFDDDED